MFGPITSKVKGYPFEVLLGGKKVAGAILSDQIKNLDWRKREVEFIEKLGPEGLAQVVAKIETVLV